MGSVLPAAATNCGEEWHAEVRPEMESFKVIGLPQTWLPFVVLIQHQFGVPKFQ